MMRVIFQTVLIAMIVISTTQCSNDGKSSYYDCPEQFSQEVDEENYYLFTLKGRIKEGQIVYEPTFGYGEVIGFYLDGSANHSFIIVAFESLKEYGWSNGEDIGFRANGIGDGFPKDMSKDAPFVVKEKLRFQTRIQPSKDRVCW